MIITMIIAAIPYMSVLFEAKPVSGVDVGAGVAAAELAWKYFDAEEQQYDCVPRNVAVTG